MGQNNSSNVCSTTQNALSTTPELVLANNPQRIGLKIRNTSTDILVYIGFNSDQSQTTTGHMLYFLQEFEMYGYTGPIWMDAASSTPTVTTIEW